MNISIEFVIHVQDDSFEQVRETHMQNLYRCHAWIEMEELTAKEESKMLNRFVKAFSYNIIR